MRGEGWRGEEEEEEEERRMRGVRAKTFILVVVGR